MAVIGNAPFQGLVSGGNILDASIEGVDLSTSAIAARLGYTPVDPGAAAITGGTINGTTIGATTRSSIAGTTELIGPSASANFTRFPNALSVVSNTASGIQHNESAYIGQMAEGVSVGSTWGVGVYGAGYTNASGTGRGTGVTGEGHVSTAADTGVAVGVRGYATDTHTGNYNIGLYGDAENGDTGLTYGGNVALFLANGSIVTSASAAKSWYLGGNLIFDGQGTAKTISATNGAVISVSSGITGTLPTANGGTNLTSFTANGLVYASSTSALATGSVLTFDGSTLGLSTGNTGGTNTVSINNTIANGYSALTVKNTGASGKTYEAGVGGNGTAGNYQNNFYIRDTTGNPSFYVNSAGAGVVGNLSVTGTTTFDGDITTTLGKFYVVNTYGYYFGTSANLTGFTGSNGTGAISVSTYGTTRATFDLNGVAVTGYLSATGNTTALTAQFGTNPAGVSIGVIGIPNQKRIYGRNTANTADINILYVSGNDTVVFGPSDVATFSTAGLAVDGTLSIGPASGAGGIAVGSAAGRAQYQYVNFGGAVGGTDYAWQIGRSPSGGVGPADGFYIYDLKASATRLSINGSGNVGVGTADPQNRLHVGGTDTIVRLSDTNGGVCFWGSDSVGTFWRSFTYDTFRWLRASGNESMRLNSSGNLIIGTSINHTAAQLYVENAINVNYSGEIAMRYNVSGQSTSYWKGMTGTMPGAGGSARGLHFFNYDADSDEGINFWTGRPGSATQLMKLTAAGNLGMGTTNPAGLLDIGANTLNSNIYFRNNGSYGSGGGGGTSVNVVFGGVNIARIANTGTGQRDAHFTLLDENVVKVSIAANSARGGPTYFNTGGNFGIAQTDPQEKLDVNGNIYIHTATGNPYLRIKTDAAGNNPSIRMQANTNYWDIQSTFSNTNDELMFIYNGANKMHLSPLGGAGLSISNGGSQIGRFSVDTDGHVQFVRGSSLNGQDYNFRFLKLFKLTTAAGGNSTEVKGTLSLSRVNEIGVSLMAEIYATQGYDSQIRVWHKRIAGPEGSYNFRFVTLVDAGSTYLCLEFISAPGWSSWQFQGSVIDHSGARGNFDVSAAENLTVKEVGPWTSVSDPGVPIQQDATYGPKLFGTNNYDYGIGTNVTVANTHIFGVPQTNGNYGEAMRIKSNGYVGIGVTDPTHTLHVSQGLRMEAFGGDLYSLNGTLSYYSATNGVYLNGPGPNGWLRLNGAGSENDVNSINIYGSAGARIEFRTAATERGRITSGGYFKISNTGVYANTAGSYHELCSSGDRTFQFMCTATTGNLNNFIYFGGQSPNNTSSYFLACDDTTNTKAIIYSNGTFGSRSNSYSALSDVKLKQDIVNATSQWNDIKNLQFRKYRFKENPTGPLQLGLISQEAELVSPGLVFESPDTVRDEEGNTVTTGEVTKSVKYSILYMKAVVALQEAMTRIEQLEARLNAAGI